MATFTFGLRQVETANTLLGSKFQLIPAFHPANKMGLANPMIGQAHS